MSRRRTRRSSAPPKPAQGPRRRPWPFVVAAGVLLLVAVTLALPFRPRTGEGRAVDVDVPSGASDADVIARLEAAGVVSGPVFGLYARVRGGILARSGRHLLRDDLSPVEVLRRLRRSPDATRIRVTFPEGWTRFEIAARLEKQRICDAASFLAAVADPKLGDELGVPGSLEGWLFPSTYELPADGDAREVVRQLVEKAKSRLERLAKENAAGLALLQKQLGWSMREVVVLASVVEKEAAVDDERPIIASVFLNRLREPASTGGKLQADPTAGYGCRVMQSPTPACVSWLAVGTHKVNADIQHDADNPWSTYTHPGLPPTAVSNPGEKSLAAVLSPAVTRYFFFVAKGGGRHNFSETLGKHEQAIPKAP